MPRPTEPIIELTKSFIKRRNKINWVRIAVCILAVLAAIFIIYQVYNKLQFLTAITNSVFVAFISLAAFLLVIVVFGLLQPTLTVSEKINDAKEINKKRVEESRKTIWDSYAEFFKNFNDILEKFYK